MRDANAKERKAMAAKKAKKKAAARKPAPRKATPKQAKKSAARKGKVTKLRTSEIVHWEIQSQTPDRLHRFYSDVFGWEIDAKNPMNYGMVKSGGSKGIEGGIGGSQAPGSRVLVYASVESIPPVLSKVEASGGKTLMPRTDIGPVIMALYEDPEGNTMGLIEG
jgi:predicted enzyme related to lactoylglutathione lyase